MRVLASSASPSRDAERGMKVFNEYLATMEGLTAGEMESRAWSTSSRKRALPLSRKKTLNCSRAPSKRKPAREKRETSNTPPMKRCSKSSPRGRRRDRGPTSNYVIILPPFTWTVCPVMCLAASLAKNATASATSSGPPGWPVGIRLLDSSHSWSE